MLGNTLPDLLYVSRKKINVHLSKPATISKLLIPDLQNPYKR